MGPVPDASGLADPARVAAVERIVSAGPVGGTLDRLAGMLADLVGAPYAQVSLLGASDQVIAAVHGLDINLAGRRKPLERSLCTVTAAAGAPLVIADAVSHPWVQQLPPVLSGLVGSYLGAPLHSADGVLLGSVCVFDRRRRDWDERDVASVVAVAKPVAAELEQHARAMEAPSAAVHLELAAGAARLGTFNLDLRGYSMVWGPRMLAMHGIQAADVLDFAQFEAVVHPEDLPAVQQAIGRGVETLGDISVEYRVLLAGGGLRWVRARGRVLPDMLGDAARILGVAYDSSRERELRDELTRLLETIPAAFVRCTRDWVLTYVNADAEGLFGRSRSVLVGQGLWAAFPEAVGTKFESTYRHAMETGQRSMVEAYFEPLRMTFEVQVWPDEGGLSLFFHDVSDRKRAYDALEELNSRVASLAEAGAQLSASLQPADVLQLLTARIVPALGRWLVLAVRSDVAELLGLNVDSSDGTRLYVAVAEHVDERLRADLLRVLDGLRLTSDARTGLGEAVRTGVPQLRPGLPVEVLDGAGGDEERTLLRELDQGRVLSVPLRSASGVLGAFTVGGGGERGLDQVLVQELAGRAAVAFDNALNFARQTRAATDLQRTLLPHDAACPPGVAVATRYLPARVGALAGGDFYKTVNVGTTFVIVLGDVMGHGTGSAARAGQLHALVAALALEGHAPGDLLRRLADGVGQMMELELATLLVCAYDTTSRLLTAATAGHPPPLVAAVSGEPAFLDLAPGPPIGVSAGSYPERTLHLPAGATVVMYSDGLVENRGESIATGQERLRSAVRELRLPPERVADHVLAELDRETGGEDDVALLVMSHR